MSSQRHLTDDALARLGLHQALTIGRTVTFTAETRDVAVLVADGVLTLESGYEAQDRRVIEFLYPGDLVSAELLHALPAMTLRAVSPGSVIHLALNAISGAEAMHLYAHRLSAQVARLTLNSLIVGQQDLDARFVSLLMELAYRTGAGARNGATVALPMSREDIAAHLSINPDTLSRVFSRLRREGVTAKLERHRLLIPNWQRLADRTPLADAITRTYAETIARTDGLAGVTG